MQAAVSPISSHETGSLTQQSPQESHFVGSSSGIYFINTVKKAFVSSAPDSTRVHLPAAEDTVGGEDDFHPSARNSLEREYGLEVNVNTHGGIEVTRRLELPSLPTYESAQQFAIAYFQTWHPLLPFLSGPDFLIKLNALYRHTLRTAFSERSEQCYLLINACVLAMGACTSASPLPSAVHAPSPSHLLSLAAALATKHDILTIQTILAAQVYCVSIMALRTASSLGGLLTKLLYHAGFHRCPYRYPQLSHEDRELRKRILWSAYAIDRYVSQALGLPVALVDSEIDVCVPGKREKHSSSGVERTQTSDYNKSQVEDGVINLSRELILANFVDHAGLVGQALEIFHASLHSRNNDPRKVIFLRSDVDKWFNNLPEYPNLKPEGTTAEEQIARFLPFFHVLYEQLIITINRPSLSLSQSAPEFHHGLQTTIRAAKRTIAALELQHHLFWPGYVASIWMSGLIISFACQIHLYSIIQGSQEILRCLSLLEKMSEQWASAQRCRATLSTLHAELMRCQNQSYPPATPEAQESRTRPSKRRRLDSSISEPSSSNVKTLPANETLYTTQENETFSFEETSNIPNEWNDFFQDLSWNNLFDMDDVAQASDFFLPTG